MTAEDDIFLKALAFQKYVRARKLVRRGDFVHVNQRTADQLATQYPDFPATFNQKPDSHGMER